MGSGHRCQAHLGVVPLSTCKEARKKDPSELRRGNEAEETGQVRVNLHGSDQQGNRADERARTTVLGAAAREINGPEPQITESWSARG